MFCKKWPRTQKNLDKKNVSNGWDLIHHGSCWARDKSPKKLCGKVSENYYISPFWVLQRNRNARPEGNELSHLYRRENTVRLKIQLLSASYNPALCETMSIKLPLVTEKADWKLLRENWLLPPKKVLWLITDVNKICLPHVQSQWCYATVLWLFPVFFIFIFINKCWVLSCPMR